MSLLRRAKATRVVVSTVSSEGITRRIAITTARFVCHVVLCYHECETESSAGHGGRLRNGDALRVWFYSRAVFNRSADGFALKEKAIFPGMCLREARSTTCLSRLRNRSCALIPMMLSAFWQNIELKREPTRGWKPDIDNSIRPIVYHAALAVSPYQFASKKR